MPETNEVTNDLLLKEIRLIKSTLKNSIETSEARLSLKLEETSKRLKELEGEVEELQSKIEILDKNQRRNNILVFGLSIPDSCDNFIDYVLNVLNEKTQSNTTINDINNLYILKHLDNKPIKIEFISYLKKIALMKNSYKLKGTNIFINNDQTYKQRQEGTLLRKYLKLARTDEPNKLCKIIKGELYIGEDKYTIEELKKIEEGDLEIRQTQSEPRTPITETTSQLKESKGIPERVISQESTNTPKKQVTKEKANYNYKLRLKNKYP